MKWRIWLLSLSIVLVGAVVFGFACTQVYYQSAVNDGKDYLRVYMNEFDAEKYPLTKKGAADYSQKLNGARVTFMDAQGNVLADSSAEPEQDHSNREEIIAAIKDKQQGGFAVRSSATTGKNTVYYCKNFNEYLVRVAIETDSDWTIFLKTMPTYASFACIAVLLCFVVSYFATDVILNPVTKLAKQAIASDSVQTDCAELKPVAEILNERSKNVARKMKELEYEKEMVENARSSKDEFIANVTHEMNTPLTSIHGYAELLDGGGMTEQQKSFAYKTILAQSERLSKLIACIINYSEIESDDVTPYEVNFSALAREMISALKPEADKRHIAVTEQIEDNVILLSTAERLGELFGNLFRNAIKYNKEGGSITVTLDRQKFVVADTGIGISEENKSKVFSRFFTVDKSHGGKNGGFGLGLAVVKKICDKSGWKVDLQSEPGKGSTFIVRF